MSDSESKKADALCFLWTLVFYFSYFALIKNWFSPMVYIFVAVVAIMRNFNALHQSFHAQRLSDGRVSENVFAYFRNFIILMGPLNLGYDQYKRNHLLHHHYEGAVGDPERYLQRGPAWVAYLNAFTHPEQAVVRHLFHNGLDRAIIKTLTLNLVAYSLLMYAGGLRGAIAYKIATRLGDSFSFWISDYWLHRPSLYGKQLVLPKLLSKTWSILFSYDSLMGLSFHGLHHQYPRVPDSKLSALYLETSKRKV